MCQYGHHVVAIHCQFVVFIHSHQGFNWVLNAHSYDKHSVEVLVVHTNVGNNSSVYASIQTQVSIISLVALCTISNTCSNVKEKLIFWTKWIGLLFNTYPFNSLLGQSFHGNVHKESLFPLLSPYHFPVHWSKGRQTNDDPL